MKHTDVEIGMRVILKDDHSRHIRIVTGQFHDSTWKVEDTQTSLCEICYSSDFEPYSDPLVETTITKTFAVAATFCQDRKNSLNIQTSLLLIKALSKEEAIGKFILEMSEKLPNHYINVRPVIVEVT